MENKRLREQRLYVLGNNGVHRIRVSCAPGLPVLACSCSSLAQLHQQGGELLFIYGADGIAKVGMAQSIGPAQEDGKRRGRLAARHRFNRALEADGCGLVAGAAGRAAGNADFGQGTVRNVSLPHGLHSALQNGLLQDGSCTVFYFQDYLLPQLLSGALAGRPSWVYYPDGLKKLKAHDESSQVSYLETLRVYLDNNLSVTKTAAALYLHRSTLLDRLAHITQMLGCDLKNPDFCLTLGILLRAELQQKRITQPKP